MPDKWTSEPLGKHAEIRARIGWRGLSASEYTMDGPYLIAGQHIDAGRVVWDKCDHLSDARYRESWEIALRPGDVILTKDGTIGRIARIDALPSQATINGTMMLVRPKSSLNYRFLFHFLSGQAFQKLVDDKVSGSSIPHIFQRDMVGLSVILPSAPEQRLIAAILDTLDEAIRQTERLIAKLRQAKQGLLHDLLTRGIAENGELRDPERHPEQFKDSPLGRIPRGWSVIRLGDVSDLVTSGSRGWAEYYADTGALFIRIGNLTREHIGLRLDDIVRVKPPKSSEGHRTRLERGDLLISITADLGIIGVVPAGLGEAYVNQHIAMVRIAPERANSRWLAYYLAGGVGQEQVRALNDSGAKAGLNLPTVRALVAALPTRTDQDEVVSRLDAIEGAILDHHLQGNKLRRLKHGLMEDLLTGHVRVTHLLVQSPK